MMMVPETTTARKPVTAFYAHLYDEAGALTKLDDTLYFVADDGTVREVEPDMLNFVCVLGEMQMAETQHLHDLVRGGAAKIACTRGH